MIVLNDVSDNRIGFESERNAVTLVEASAETAVAIAPKAEIADAILDRVAELREGSWQEGGPRSRLTHQPGEDA
jgi:phosphopantothenoylcysteine synthetase/decarboxylase